MAQSADLLKRYKNAEVNWNDFKVALLAEFQDNSDSVEAIHTLRYNGNMQDVTLLCYEKDGKPCHRHMVKDLIEKPRLLKLQSVPKDTGNEKSTMTIPVSDVEYPTIP